MKVAVSCDSIVSRDYTVSVVESVLALYEDAELYTVVHKEGGVLGPIEQRRIQSTYLSSLIKDDHARGEQWWNKSHLIPGACKNLHIPCSVDVLINISSGFSHGFARCDGVYQITYLLENSFLSRKKRSWKEKLFSGFVENWANKAILKSDELWVSNTSELEYWQSLHPKVSLMSPFFKSSDFPLFPKATRKSLGGNFLCFDAPSFELDDALRVIEKCEAENIKYKFTGRDEHLLKGISEEKKEHFFGERCSGELAPFFAGSRGFITLQTQGFPSRAMNAMSTGTPVAFKAKTEASSFVRDQGEDFSFIDFEDLLVSLTNLFEKMADCEPKELHNQTNKFHDLKFRGEFVRRMKGVEELVSQASSSC